MRHMLALRCVFLLSIRLGRFAILVLLIVTIHIYTVIFFGVHGHVQACAILRNIDVKSPGIVHESAYACARI